MLKILKEFKKKGSPARQMHHAGDVPSTLNQPPLSSSADARINAAIEAAARFTIDPLTTVEEIASALHAIRKRREEPPQICGLKGGAVAFAMAAFPGAPLQAIHAQLFSREPLGRGAHFDVYNGLLDSEFPWVAVFNLAGDCEIAVYPLPEDLSRQYRSAYTSASDDAYLERRRISAIARCDRSVEPIKGLLWPGHGLILPQRKDGLDWVHEIVPVDPERPGRFAKFLIPEGTAAVEFLDERGYATFDGVVTQCFREVPVDLMGLDDDSRKRRCNID